MPPLAMEPYPVVRLGTSFPKWANRKQARKLVRDGLLDERSQNVFLAFFLFLFFVFVFDALLHDVIQRQ